MLPRRPPRCVWHPWRWEVGPGAAGTGEPGAGAGVEGHQCPAQGHACAAGQAPGLVVAVPPALLSAAGQRLAMLPLCSAQPPCHTLRSRMHASTWKFKPAAPPGPGRFSVTQQVPVPAPSVCALGSDSYESPACLLICVNQTTCEGSSSERGFAGSWASSAGTLARDSLRGPPHSRPCGPAPSPHPALWSPPPSPTGPVVTAPAPPPGPFPAAVIGLPLLFAGFLLVILRPRERVTVPGMLTVPGRAAASSLSQNDFRTQLFEKIPRKEGLIKKSCPMYNWTALLHT